MLLLLILSTAYDLTMRRKNREFSLLSQIYFHNLVCRSLSGDQKILFSTFSVYTNGKNLFETNQTSSNHIINCLDGIRACSIAWVVHGNHVQTYVDFPLINKRQFREVYMKKPLRFMYGSLINVIALLQHWPNTWASVLTTSTPMAINTFFLLSGLLATKSILKKLDEK
jgi:hypothetical protein